MTSTWRVADIPSATSLKSSSRGCSTMHDEPPSPTRATFGPGAVELERRTWISTRPSGTRPGAAGVKATRISVESPGLSTLPGGTGALTTRKTPPESEMTLAPV
jgi:hypothetical protein